MRTIIIARTPHYYTFIRGYILLLRCFVMGGGGERVENILNYGMQNLLNFRGFPRFILRAQY